METGQSSRWPYFYMVAAGVFMSTMDSSMINVALPSIMRSFSTPLSVTQLIVLVYLSTITITLVLWGHLSDIYGKSRVYLAGVLTFSIAAAGCSFAVSLPQLVLTRCIQGLGAAMMMSTGPAIIKMVFPPEQIGRGLGLVGVATSCGLMSGPVVSGLLIQLFSWRGVFLVTIPFSLSVYCVGRHQLGKEKRNGKVEDRKCYDWIGFTLWAAAILQFISLISFYEKVSPYVLVFCIFTLLSTIVLFGRHQQRARVSILPSVLFRRKYFVAAAITATLSFAVLFMVILLIPFYLDYILLMSADRIGLIMLALPSSLVFVSPFAGWIYDRIGARLPTTLGLAISCVAVLSMTGLNKQTTVPWIIITLSMLGAGQALFLSPNSASILARVEGGYLGVASGILATARNLGMMIGVGLSGAVFSFVFAQLSGGNDLHGFQSANVPEFLSALHWTFSLASLLSLGGCLLSFFRDS